MGKITKIRQKLPLPTEVGVVVPAAINQEMYQQGWEHGLVSNLLTKPEQLKASFRAGFRAAKLYLRELRKQKGIHVLPLQARIKFRPKE